MPYENASRINTVQQKDCVSSGQEPLLSSADQCMENGVLNLVLTKDKVKSCETVQKARSEAKFSAGRDATEGLQVPRKMSTSYRPLGVQQTTGGEQGMNVKSIDITDVANKFLMGTMNALSRSEGGPNLGMASPVESSLFCLEKIPVNTDSVIEYSNSGSSSIPSHTTAPGEQQCSPLKKSRPNARPSRPPLLPPCRVCGDRASGYHYGVNTCEACKGFFRRSICKTDPYVCTGSGDCKTLRGKRTSCSHCRFKSCITMGMSKNAIKTGRYTHELRSKNILEVKRLQKQGSDESSDQSSEEMSSSDTNYMEYQNEHLRKSLLEETLGILISGQKMLYEFLDDYYNEELMQERQLSVYGNFMERKRILLGETDSQTTQVEHHNEQIEHHNGPAKCHTPQTQHRNEQTECYTQNEHHIGHTSRTERHNSYIESHTESDEYNVVQPRDKVSDGPVRTYQNNVRINDCSENLMHSECNTSSLNICSNGAESSAAQRQVVDVAFTDDVRKIHIQSNEHADIKPSAKNETCKDFKSAGEEQKQVLEMRMSDDLTIPGREKLRAEVMTNIINDMEQGVQGMLAFAKCLPGFVELSTQDQASLLKAARFDIWYIGHIRCFNVELRVGACEWQFHAEELAQVWGDSMVDLAFRLSKAAQTLELTKHETAALRAVCLTFPDRCTDLQNREELEQMHEHMLEVFKFVSCKRHVDYNKWFTKVINFLVMLREFGVKFESISSRLKLDWSVLKDNPLLLSVFLS